MQPISDNIRLDNDPVEAEKAEQNAVDGRTRLLAPWHERDWTDEQIDMHVPTHIVDNYDGVVAGQYAGDYGRFATEMQATAERTGQHGDAVLAAWARRQAHRNVGAVIVPGRLDPALVTDDGKAATAEPINNAGVVDELVDDDNDPSTPPVARRKPSKSTT